MERKIIDYLPPYLTVYKEIKAIMEAEQPEFEIVWPQAENVLNDQFVSDSSTIGIERMEKILGIIPKKTDTLDERKFRILVKLNEQLPYTLPVLKQQLKRMCGENGYRLILSADKYLLNVKLDLGNENNYQDVCDMLRRVVPANMVISVSMFNTHEILSHYTHAQLAVYTQKQVREEVLTNV